MSHVFRGAIAALASNLVLGCAVGDELTDEAIQKAAVRDQILLSASVSATMEEMEPGGNLLDLPTRPNGMPGASGTTTASATPPAGSNTGMPPQSTAGGMAMGAGFGMGGAAGTMTGAMPGATGMPSATATSSASAMPSAPPPGGGFFGGMMMASPDQLAEVAGATLLIDDLEDGDALVAAVEGRNGRWFSFSDGNGSQTFSIDPECNRAPPSSVACAHSSASAFPEYAGIGFSFHEDGRAVDASRHQGIRFYVRNTTPGDVTVSLLTASSVAADGSPGFEASVDVGESWTQVGVAFEHLELSSWYEGVVVSFDATELVEVQIHTGGLAHELFVDDVEFY